MTPTEEGEDRVPVGPPHIAWDLMHHFERSADQEKRRVRFQSHPMRF
jgi:hypothetical protein